MNVIRGNGKTIIFLFLYRIEHMKKQHLCPNSRFLWLCYYLSGHL
nr:MAG TPA: hypothetical protein [Caudoviricetes sp.]